MPTEWIIAALVTAISTLSTVVVVLWRDHKAGDERERARSDALEKRLSEVVDILKRARPRT